MESPVEQLQRRKRHLVSRFLATKEPQFLIRHAEVLDDYFRDSFARSAVGPRMRMDKNPYTFIALGGYGRREQCLHSDIDVLLLFRKKIPDQAKELIQEIIYPLWDLGLEVSYSTRTLKDCINLAAQDFEVLTSLMDARFLCGISFLYLDLVEAMRLKILGRHATAFVQWLVERSRERHTRFGDSSYLLEPNLKEGLGGLRDYHVMLWIARAKYQLKEPRDLEYLGHLSHQEFESTSLALDFIWTVRNWLHHAAQRHCDQLYFEYQVAISRSMGFEAENGQQPVERFLGTLHGHMEFLKQQHLTLVSRALPRKQRLPSALASRRLALSGIELLQDALTFESAEAILENPYLLLTIFDQSASLGVPLTVEARRLVKEFRHLIDDEIRSSHTAAHVLKRILMAPVRSVDVLEEMLNTGALVSLIPEMQGLIHRIQYDEYHLYPVDKHSLRTIQMLKGWGSPSADDQEGLFRQIFAEIARPDLLLWAGLFHDIGKSLPGQDHARHGAELARAILRRLHFSDPEIDTTAFLIREHLLLVNIATHRDLNDEKIVVQCARQISDVERLKMLYLLTVADSKATGPKAWNDWIAVLLKELFFKALHILERGELATPVAVNIVAKKRDELFRVPQSLSRDELGTLFEQMSLRYLHSTSVKEILRHIELYRRLGDGDGLVETHAHRGSRYRSVTVCAKDRPGLFSRIAGVFTLNNLNILSAEIYTWRNGIALDIFKVTAPPDPLREEDAWARVRDNLRGALKGELDLELALDEKVQAYQAAARSHTGLRPDRIVVDNRASDFFTIVEIYTHDFPGLLYKVTNALFRCRLNIWVAKIATKVDQVVDIFYVRDFDGQKVDSPEQVAAINETIGCVLSASPTAGKQGF
ncbi:MAG TPA: [protein-PII] uridylyltransferase [Syntrophobacteria bacterium]|nr:[protein-PII] uridylyltransferase [Syntrophobacteria bacterium]